MQPNKYIFLKIPPLGTSVAVQRLRRHISKARDTGSIPDQRTRIPPAMQHSQISNFKKYPAIGCSNAGWWGGTGSADGDVETYTIPPHVIPPGVHVLPLGVYSTPSILPTALEPLYVSLTLHLSTWGLRKLPQLGSGEPGCQARPKDTKAHPLSTAPARRHGKGHAGGRHSTKVLRQEGQMCRGLLSERSRLSGFQPNWIAAGFRPRHEEV